MSAVKIDSTRSEANSKVFTYRCPLCERDDNLSLRPGDFRPWLWKCRTCGGGLDFLKALGEALGLDDWRRLLDGPVPELGAPSTVRSPRWGPPEDLPTRYEVQEWGNLARSREPLAYLRSRGLSREVVTQWHLGWDDDSDTYKLPVYGPFGEIVNLVTHTPGGTPKYRSLRGHPAALWPEMPDSQSVILCAGMFDPIVARERGLNKVVSTTCGCSFPAKLAPRFKGKRIAVVFDVGEEDKAQLAASKLLAAGAEAAFVVSLGLPNKGDDLGDWFVKYGRSRAQLLRLIRRARP